MALHLHLHMSSNDVPVYRIVVESEWTKTQNIIIYDKIFQSTIDPRNIVDQIFHTFRHKSEFNHKHSIVCLKRLN